MIPDVRVWLANKVAGLAWPRGILLVEANVSMRHAAYMRAGMAFLSRWGRERRPRILLADDQLDVTEWGTGYTNVEFAIGKHEDLLLAEPDLTRQLLVVDDVLRVCERPPLYAALTRALRRADHVQLVLGTECAPQHAVSQIARLLRASDASELRDEGDPLAGRVVVGTEVHGSQGVLARFKPGNVASCAYELPPREVIALQIATLGRWDTIPVLRAASARAFGARATVSYRDYLDRVCRDTGYPRQFVSNWAERTWYVTPGRDWISAHQCTGAADVLCNWQTALTQLPEEQTLETLASRAFTVDDTFGSFADRAPSYPVGTWYDATHVFACTCDAVLTFRVSQTASPCAVYDNTFANPDVHRVRVMRTIPGRNVMGKVAIEHIYTAEQLQDIACGTDAVSSRARAQTMRKEELARSVAARLGELGRLLPWCAGESPSLERLHVVARAWNLRETCGALDALAETLRVRLAELYAGLAVRSGRPPSLDAAWAHRVTRQLAERTERVERYSLRVLDRLRRDKDLNEAQRAFLREWCDQAVPSAVRNTLYTPIRQAFATRTRTP